MGGTQGKVSAADRAGSCGGAGNEGALASRVKGRENVEEQKGGTLSHLMDKAFVWGCASVWGTPTLQLVNRGAHD